MKLFESLSEVFNPAQDQKVSDRKRQIMTSIMEANTCEEVSMMVRENRDFFDEHRFLYQFAADAMKRINDLVPSLCL